MRTPLAVVTGLDPVAMDSTLMALAWDLDRAVCVRHRIDPFTQTLTRIVSDASGVIEHHELTLEHACVTCALREDILPTLERLAQDGRWSSIVAGLPLGTEADQLAHILSTDRRWARRLKLSAIVASVAAERLGSDLMSSQSLHERQAHCNPDDERGVGEVVCAQIEFADVIVLDGQPSPDSRELLEALARPDADIVVGADRLDAERLIQGRHQHSVATAWFSPELDVELAPVASANIWRLQLQSEQPFHPDRLLDRIEDLGAGPYRSRGSFWLPTRPTDMLEWSGVGGQLSIGNYRPWGRRPRTTRLIFTGLRTSDIDALTADLRAVFGDLVLSSAEAAREPRTWDVVEDGLEPWLGQIRDVA